MRFALIGNGPWSKTIQRLLSEMSIEYVVYTHNWKSDLNQAEESYDAVMVLTPAPTQVPIALELIERGVGNIWLEKSAIVTFSQLSALSNARIYSNYIYYFHLAVRFMMKNVKTIISYEGEKVNPDSATSDGDLLRYLGIHDLYKFILLGGDLSGMSIRTLADGIEISKGGFKSVSKLGGAKKRYMCVRSTDSRFLLLENDHFFVDGKSFNLGAGNPLMDSIREFVVMCATGVIPKWNVELTQKLVYVLDTTYFSDSIPSNSSTTS